ncbi:hypothetical protein L596_023258 [Steinernema carpocapsae]|uniref:Piwi domain-containing protein n=1 Tax=Steinernema carpocapsae TaxID=34508 RepID=A0A4U5MD46_STECR|nr:hypothetical protein L596_023258 [Steinernema carpocapsae]
MSSSSSVSSDDTQVTSGFEARGRAIATLEDMLEIRIPPIVDDQKRRSETELNTVNVRTNVYEFELPTGTSEIYHYEVAVIGKLKSGRTVDLTARTTNDVLTLERRDSCRKVLGIVSERYPAVFDHNLVFYDQARLLFTSKNVEINTAAGIYSVILGCQDHLKGDEMFAAFTSVEFRLARVSVVEVGNVQKYLNKNLRLVNHSLEQYLNVLTSQHVANKTITFGNESVYLEQDDQCGVRNNVDLGSGKLLKTGFAKASRLIEGLTEQPAAALVVDLKKAAFHVQQTVLDKARLILQADRKRCGGSQPRIEDTEDLSRELVGLVVETKHGSRVRKYKIAGFDKSTPASRSFEKDGRNVLIADYFAQQYKVKVENLDTPLVIVRGYGRDFHLPMELCYVKDQRVGLKQQTPDQIKDMIKQCAVKPVVRIAEIEKIVKGLRLIDERKDILGSKVGIKDKPLKVEGHLLPPPLIVYADKDTCNQRVPPSREPASNGTWSSLTANTTPAAFFKPAKIEKWAVIAIHTEDNGDPHDERNKRILAQNTLETNILHQFATVFTEECRNRGMTLPEAEHVKFLDDTSTTVRDFIHQAKLSFVLFVCNNAITHIHQSMKCYERKFETVTQDVRMATVNDIMTKRRFQTLENIVAKTNVKNGGLNYNVEMPSKNGVRELMPKGRLVIGLTVRVVRVPKSPKEIEEDKKKAEEREKQHKKARDSKFARKESTTAKLKPIMTVGYAANFTDVPTEFIGDHLYQEYRETGDILGMQIIFERVVLEFKRARGMFPTEIVIYRECTENSDFIGQLQLEQMLLKSAIKSTASFRPGFEPKLTLIAVQKRHHVRLMPIAMRREAKAPEQNLQPGTVVDRMITHPEFTEFYLNSHTTLQGTARIPRYTVLKDENNLSMHEVQLMTYGLSYAHQIVNSPTSLPTPVYVAVTCAERGMNLAKHNFRAMNIKFNANDDYSKLEDQHVDISHLNEQLSFGNCKLSSIRNNA